MSRATGTIETVDDVREYVELIDDQARVEEPGDARREVRHALRGTLAARALRAIADGNAADPKAVARAVCDELERAEAEEDA